MPGDITGNVLQVRESKTPSGIRSVGISPELADELRTRLPFRSLTGRRLSYRDFRRSWDRAVEGMLCGDTCKVQCDVHPRIAFTPKDLRDGHATWLLANGARC
jgi:integrase